MTAPGLHMAPHQWQQVADILNQHLPGQTIYAFGSRATGNRLKKYSDLDLAIPGRINSMTHANLVDAFDESLLPFKVDIVELELCDPAFCARIATDFIPLTFEDAAQNAHLA